MEKPESMEEAIDEHQSPEFQLEGLVTKTTTSSLPPDCPATTDGNLSPNAELGVINERMQQVAQDSGYNSSGSSIQQSPGDTLDGDLDDGELALGRSRTSSHTSISSIPASILINLPESMKPIDTRDSHECMFQPWDHQGCNGHSRGEGHVRQFHTIRQREATFRKPSSVRAMQMYTEDEGDDEYLTPPKRRGGQRISDISMRSAGSSPLKRSPFYSPTNANKPKVKKEYPLVLLHCTLLPPSLSVPELVVTRDQIILREVLPTVYWKRWKLLEEKIGSGVLRDRGVLISHPEDMYDLLEERLLESLELQHPRLDNGHFLGNDETESDREDQLNRDDSGAEDEGEQCPDCGGRVVRPNAARKWEIKVFAANGLMRAGAWAAAWKEMEKVDVEVGLWLPSNVRAELEKRLAEELASQIDKRIQIPLLQEPEGSAANLMLRAPSPTLRKDEPVLRAPSPPPSMNKAQDIQYSSPPLPKPSEEIALQTLLVNYVRVLASDRRNVAIVFLSILLVFGAINSRSDTPNSDLRPFPKDMLDYVSSSMVAQQQQQQQVSETWIDLTSLAVPSITTSDAAGILASTQAPESLSELVVLSTIAPSVVELKQQTPIVSETSIAETSSPTFEVDESEQATSSSASPVEESAQATSEAQELPTSISVPLVEESAQATPEVNELLSSTNESPVEESTQAASETEEFPVPSHESRILKSTGVIPETRESSIPQIDVGITRGDAVDVEESVVLETETDEESPTDHEIYDL